MSNPTFTLSINGCPFTTERTVTECLDALRYSIEEEDVDPYAGPFTVTITRNREA